MSTTLSTAISVSAVALLAYAIRADDRDEQTRRMHFRTWAKYFDAYCLNLHKETGRG